MLLYNYAVVDRQPQYAHIHQSYQDGIHDVAVLILKRQADAGEQVFGDGVMGLSERPDEADQRIFSVGQRYASVSQFVLYTAVCVTFIGVNGHQPDSLVSGPHRRPLTDQVRIIWVVDALHVIQHQDVVSRVIQFHGRYSINVDKRAHMLGDALVNGTVGPAPQLERFIIIDTV